MEHNNNICNLEAMSLNVTSPPHSEPLDPSDKETTLITKVLTPKPTNMNALKATMIKAWNPSGKISSNLLSDNTMAFIFEERKDMEKVYNQAWTFRDHQMVVAKWPPDKALTEIDLTKTLFWVHIFGLPVCFINLENAKFIGDGIGKFVKEDLGPGQKWKYSLKMQIEIDTQEPLLGAMIFQVGGTKIKIEIRYERIVDFCYLCGHLGHKAIGCPNSGQEGCKSLGNESYGAWLKFENNHIPNPGFKQLKNPLNVKKVLNTNIADIFNREITGKFKMGPEITQIAPVIRHQNQGSNVKNLLSSTVEAIPGLDGEISEKVDLALKVAHIKGNSYQTTVVPCKNPIKGDGGPDAALNAQSNPNVTDVNGPDPIPIKNSEGSASPFNWAENSFVNKPNLKRNVDSEFKWTSSIIPINVDQKLISQIDQNFGTLIERKPASPPLKKLKSDVSPLQDESSDTPNQNCKISPQREIKYHLKRSPIGPTHIKKLHASPIATTNST
ncbi:hypothetical protein CASFOL_019715 [Castilleja foliolosa]|uniref:CCHC-type domain-containing protein n=1 Tax=Castilleja foliolosa TaxID=1961234 RepID=A0ABD3CYT3_9LAMI